MFPVHLTYSINKGIIIHVFYRPWHQYCIIWLMDMRQNISSGVSKTFFLPFNIKVEYTSAIIFFWDITKKTKKDSIIVLRNGKHPLQMIYFVIIPLIKLCVCYYKFGTGLIIVLQFAVHVYLITILKWSFQSRRIA